MLIQSYQRFSNALSIASSMLIQCLFNASQLLCECFSTLSHGWADWLDGWVGFGSVGVGCRAVRGVRNEVEKGQACEGNVVEKKNIILFSVTSAF